MKGKVKQEPVSKEVAADTVDGLWADCPLLP